MLRGNGQPGDRVQVVTFPGLGGPATLVGVGELARVRMDEDGVERRYPWLLLEPLQEEEKPDADN